MSPRRPTYAVAYFRVSTAEQGVSGLGMEAQQSAVKAFAETRGWRVIAEFSDIASGKTDNRPGFKAALAECRRMGAFLVAAKLDRITRRVHTLSALLEDGIRPRTADMPDADDMMLRVYAAMVQRERELISDRTKVALKAAKARGTKLGGDRGYRGGMPPDAALAAVARVEKANQAACRLMPIVTELQVAGATSLRQIAAGLNAQGLTTRRGKTWDATAVARVLARAVIPAAEAA